MPPQIDEVVETLNSSGNLFCRNGNYVFVNFKFFNILILSTLPFIDYGHYKYKNINDKGFDIKMEILEELLKFLQKRFN